MIISHKYRFIFIKTLKTAGTSIEVFLSQVCGRSDVFTPIYPPHPRHRPRNFGQFYNHISAFAVRLAVPPDLWSDYFKFCVERNPWDKTLSHYAMENHRIGGSLSFDDYLTRRELCVNYPLYTDEDDKTLLVDRVLRYERLDAELTEVFGQLGVPFPGELRVRAKAGYRSQQGPYQQYYSDAQRHLIERAFAWECEHLGYRF